MNNHSGHFVMKCRYCETVISQCRCISNNKEKRWDVCNVCLSKISTGHVLMFSEEYKADLQAEDV